MLKEKKERRDLTQMNANLIERNNLGNQQTKYLLDKTVEVSNSTFNLFGFSFISKTFIQTAS
jgi:hypothetical protein